MLYFLKLSISLSVVYLFYQVLLRKLTFYNWNRWYLLIYSVLCFFIPLVDVFGLLKQQGLQNAAIINYVPALTQLAAAETTGTGAGINSLTVGVGIFIAGCLLLFTRLLIQFLSLRRLRASAVLLTDGNVKIYHIDKKIIPFSAGNSIYVNRYLHEEHELKEIVRHEFIHVKQRHSIDLWWGEILCILNWYNPFAWLLRNAMRQNLEFIADHQVLQSGLDARQYQYLLLKVTGNYSYSIASNFNFSSLKKRIAMMNKNKSARRHLVRFLVMLPLLAVVLLAFRKVAVNVDHYYSVNKITDTIPAPMPPVQVTDLLKQKGIKQITKNTKEHKVYIKFLDGTTKVFDLNKPSEKEALEDEYGDLMPPPPVPAIPAVAPKPGRVPAAPAAPETSPAVAPALPAPVPTPPTPPVHTKDQVVEAAIAIDNTMQEVPVRPIGISEVRVTGPIKAPTVLRADLIEIRPATAIAGPVASVVEETNQLAEIKNTTTRQELENLVEELKAKGYALTLSNLRFNDGKLITLEGAISNGSDKSGFAADNFKSLTIGVSKNNSDRFYVWIHSGSIRAW
jgi:hypothetical protein